MAAATTWTIVRGHPISGEARTWTLEQATLSQETRATLLVRGQEREVGWLEAGDTVWRFPFAYRDAWDRLYRAEGIAPRRSEVVFVEGVAYRLDRPSYQEVPS